jgi:hypothetical protein
MDFRSLDRITFFRFFAPIGTRSIEMRQILIAKIFVPSNILSFVE